MSKSSDFNNHSTPPQKGELARAALDSNFDVFQDLLSRGADVNDRHRGITPLMSFSARGKADIVETLLNKDALINLQSDGGYTALICAAAWGHEDIVKMLLGMGADATLKDQEGYTALDWALGAKNKNLVIEGLLLHALNKPAATPPGNAP